MHVDMSYPVNPPYVQVEHGSMVDHLAMDHDHPPPTEDEQQQMAEWWAREEANAPRGWDDEEELDYTVLSQRQARHPSASPERKGSGTTCNCMYLHTIKT